ncbi:hypothetical protein [Flavobacterium tructae]|uniref:Carboxypeptidase-like regulatory domain-containing protein n=1 Tax=Flavobacterium tructae TaxID=1114873 RepID=A0A1S1JD46_9FLAO|nr:hypothetical protein [Flavobacterium tructae]OHT46193.1 hypothetical protein BHE19_01365 [Flavobacterium tructae]OXB22151.1 hypothetical protein B0A71_01390 [Flavobacterium tructae]
MKVKLLTTISFFTYQLSISQSEKLLHGKVICNYTPLNKVEVINKTAKTSTTTNNLGEFSILVKSKDSLLFFSKDYFFTRLKITQENIDQNNIIVNMVIKPEELNEVVITNIKFDRVKTSQQNIDDIKLAKDAGSLEKYTGVYNGTITNGINFVRIGKGLSNLFSNKEDEPAKNKISKTDFKKLVAASIPDDFFIKNLNLKPEEKELFIEFCDADPRSKSLLENSNILITMDFMYAKNEEFKTLKTNIKN